MNRQSTLDKENAVLKEFQRLLRSGRNYDAGSMYADAGARWFIAGPTAGNIVRRYYRKRLKDNPEMVTFVIENKSLNFKLLMKDFSKKFHICERESRLIIGYIR